MSSSIQNKVQELPSHYADRLGILYAAKVSQEHKKQKGQFFTHLEIASYMASLSDFKGHSIRILDPGCGLAVLSCALIEFLVDSNRDLKKVELVAFETDQELIPIAKHVLNYLQKWGVNQAVKIETTLFEEDFILYNSDYLKESENLFPTTIAPFDIVISNPPYFKLSINDKRSIAAKIVVNGHPNIYAIFMALSAKMLKDNGELMFITPRSYAAGGYFKVFRGFFFSLIQLEKAHLFVSRKDTFNRDKVLQETVIIKGVKQKKPLIHGSVIISSSTGIKDLSTPQIREFPRKDIIDFQTGEKILYLPISNYEKEILEIFRSWQGNLAKYNIKISTGPVVAFRANDFIEEETKSVTEGHENLYSLFAPLFWMHNVKQMTLEWPVAKKNKGQYIQVTEKSKSLLILNKNYVFLRRFSSKDDKNRLIAAPYFCNSIMSDYIGVENKVNYIYRVNGQLERSEIVGLCALLNSSLFDSYFRIFNGNVNVSATELREMPLPPISTIKEIGNTIILSNNFSVENTNRIVKGYFEPVFST